MAAGCNEAAAVDVRMEEGICAGADMGWPPYEKEKAVTGTRCGNTERRPQTGSFTGRTDSGKASERHSLSDRCRTGRYRPNNNERYGSPERSRCDCL